MRTELDAVETAQRGQELGAGEIVLNSIDADGTREGYDVEFLRAVTDSVSIPVVASGGAGSLEHLRDAVTQGHAACGAGGVDLSLRGLQRARSKRVHGRLGIPMRLDPYR